MTGPPAVVTIGVFDGMHRGHQAVVRRARLEADRHRARLVVYSFATHPQVVLSHAGAPPLLTTTGEKVRLLMESGAEEVRMLRFNSRLRKKGPRRFLEDHVFPHYRLAHLVVGYDFAMGRERRGSFPVLVELGRRTGFGVQRVEPESEGSEPVSSTRIREALQAGRVDEARALLGRFYALGGRVVEGDGLGGRFGFPTANLDVPENKLVPGRGVYAAWVRTHPQEPAHEAVLNIGVRPTVGGDRERLEAHVLDYSGDLRGDHLQIIFVARLRDERKFNSINELADQIRRDVARGRELLAGSEAPLSP